MITLPKNLTEIGDEAFAHCSGMRDQIVVAPDGVEHIGKMAFAGTYIDELRTTAPDYTERGDADGN